MTKKLTGKKILVVDDEPDLVEIVSDELQFAGATTLGASGGLEALRILDTTHVDAIVTDVRMPKGSGLELLDEVKKRHAMPPVVLFLSGFSDLTHEEAFHRGTDAIFSKPCDFEALVNSIARALLPPIVRWQVDEMASQANDISIELLVEGHNQVSEGKIFNIGRGGMFVSKPDWLPGVGTVIGFKIRFKSAEEVKLVFQGSAACRWVRPKEQANLSAGVGLEFLSLTSDSITTLIRLLDQLRPAAYIPKH